MDWSYIYFMSEPVGATKFLSLSLGNENKKFFHSNACFVYKSLASRSGRNMLLQTLKDQFQSIRQCYIGKHQAPPS